MARAHIALSAIFTQRERKIFEKRERNNGPINKNANKTKPIFWANIGGKSVEIRGKLDDYLNKILYNPSIMFKTLDFKILMQFLKKK